MEAAGLDPKPEGATTGIAVDHLDPMRTAIAHVRGVPPESIQLEGADRLEASSAKILSRYASTLLLDLNTR